MSVHTRSQKLAQEAFACVTNRGQLTKELRQLRQEVPRPDPHLRPVPGGRLRSVQTKER